MLSHYKVKVKKIYKWVLHNTWLKGTITSITHNKVEPPSFDLFYYYALPKFYYILNVFVSSFILYI